MEIKKKKETEMPFLDHLEELRWRILKSLASVGFFTIASFPFSGILLNLLTRPNDLLSAPAKLIFLKPTGMILVRMELALVVGVLVSLPVIFYQFWQFVSPGLMPNERKYFLPSLFYTTLCFIAGTFFSYYVMIPVVLPFLYSMGTESIQATININEYISFVMRLILVSGAIFELPILSFFLSRVGLLKPDFLRKYRRYGIVIIVILAAFVTPPDPASQILMAFPLVFLYEISIWVARIGYRRKKKRDDIWEKEYGDSGSPTDSDA
ncbi:MAG TPA: twin-arginine translocase subunit TatC [bacterium]|nr:twin-arginine translocase subunit TatC [bacterium]